MLPRESFSMVFYSWLALLALCPWEDTMILFTTKTCPKCELVKKHITDWNAVEVMDIGTSDGMAEFLMCNIKTREVPILVDSETICTGPQSIIAYLKDKGAAQ